MRQKKITSQQLLFPSFKEAVMRAYRNEHGIKTLKEVAALVGGTPQAISDNLQLSDTSKAATLNKFLTPLRSPEGRQMIQAAWLRGTKEDPDIDRPRSVNRDIDQLIRAGLPNEAFRHIEIYSREDRKLNDLVSLLKDAIRVGIQVDRPERILEVAIRVYEKAKSENRQDVMAWSLALVARHARKCGLEHHEVKPLWDDALLLASHTAEAEFATDDMATLARNIVECEMFQAVFSEANWHGTSREKLEEILQSVERRAAKEDSSKGVKVSLGIIKGLALVALGRPEEAEDILDAVIARLGPRHSYLAHPLESKVYEAYGQIEEAIGFNRQVLRRLEGSGDAYFTGLARAQLSRLLLKGLRQNLPSQYGDQDPD